MKTFAWATLGVLALAAGVPARAQPALPQTVQTAVDESRRHCTERSAFKPGFVVEKDINGDGRKDYILDYGKFQCGDSLMFYCGTGGCLTQVFASRRNGGYVKVLDENVRGLRFRQVKGTPAMLLDLHGSACGKVGAETCRATRFWNGASFNPAN